MAKHPTRIRATSRLLALEPRLLFDGAAAIAVDQATQEAPDDAAIPDGARNAGDQVPESGDFSAAAPALVFIDSRVPGYADLAAELQAAGAQVQVIAQDASGLQAVGNALAQAGNVGSLQIIGVQTRGGDVQLGSDALTGAAATLANAQGWDYYLSQDADVDVQGVQNPDSVLPASARGALLALEATAPGAIGDVKNTSDDGKVTVGENDQAAPVAADWQVTGSGSITVSVSGGAKGTLSHSAGSLSFTGTAGEVTAWLDGVQYAYTGSSQVGDSDSLTLTFTSYQQDGTPNTPVVRQQEVSIAPQNDAPEVGKNGQVIAQVAEGGSWNFGAAIKDGSGFSHAWLGITDLDNIPEQVIIKLESIPDPAHGSLVLTLAGGRVVTLAVGSTLSVADLENLSYVHTGKQVSPANGAATPPQTFSFTVDDGAGGRLTGQTVSIELTPVNQAPTVSGSVTIIEGEKNVSLGAGVPLPVIAGPRGQLAGSDVDDSQLSYTITELPKIGTLSYNGVLLTGANIGSTVISDLNLLTYSYPEGSEPKDHGGKVDFSIRVKDSGGGTGTPAQSSSVISLTILENNDDPTLANNVVQDYAQLQTQGMVSNNSFTLTQDMLSVTDSDSFANNLVFNIKQADTAGGYFTVNGKLLGPNTSFTLQDVQQGKVAYHLRSGSTEARTDSFQFTVTDSATGLLFYGNNQVAQRDGGIYDSNLPDSELKKFTFEVKIPAFPPGPGGELPGLPEIPVGFIINGDKTFTLLEGAGTSAGSSGYTLTTADLSTTDGVSSSDKITYRLEELPASGTLYLGNRALNQFDSFTQADIDSGKLVFKHGGGEQFADLFRFSVSNGSITTDALNSFDIVVTPQNDTPTAAQRDKINLLEGSSIVINGPGLGHIVLSDSDQSVAGAGGYANQNALWLEVTKLPTTGTLFLVNGASRTPVAVGDRITQADLAAGKLVYEHNGDEVFTDSFTIRPVDNQKVGTGESGGTNVTGTNHTSLGAEVVIAITIAPDNDAPVLDATKKNELTKDAGNALPEGGKAIIYGTTVPQNATAPYGQLVYTDADNSQVQIQFRVTEATKYGQLYKGGVALKVGSVFTQADLDAGLISYVHNGGEGHSDSFKYLVSDGDHTVNDQGASQQGSVFRIELDPSNDSPVFSGKPSVPILVDGTNPTHNKAPGFQLSDPDLAVLNPGEFDLITVIVRVVDANGNPVTWGGALGDVTLSVNTVNGVTGQNNAINTYLQLTGSVANINAALASLAVGFSADLNAKYQLQVIADDRLNAAGTGHQNGGAGVIANGGKLNHISAGDTAVDANAYNWATATTTSLTGSFNLALATAELWVSTVNEPATLTVPGTDYVVQEDVPFKLTDIVFSDKESETFGTSVSVTLQVGSGTLSARDLPSGITATGNASGTLTLTGSVTALNAFLSSDSATQGVFYTSAANVNHDTNGSGTGNEGDATLTVTLKEGASNIGAPASGGSAIGGDVGNGSVENTEIVKTVAIVITAINDKPTIVPPTATVPVNSENWINVGRFEITDVDAADDYVEGETNGTIEVTVRLLDGSGKPLSPAEYARLGIELGNSATTSGVGVDGRLNGVGGALQLRGKLADIQNYLDGLQVRFSNATTANVDAVYRVEVIVDDRLRDADGSLLTGQANGGALNQDGPGTAVISSRDDFNVYADKVGEYGVYNVVGATRDMFVSSRNDPAEIGIDGTYHQDTATLEATETTGQNTVTLEGLTIRDSDAHDSEIEVTVTLPAGFSFSATTPPGVINAGGQSLTLTGTLAQINAALAATHVNLPDVAGDAQAQDWNGSFTFTVEINDRGNTGVTPDTAPAPSNGNTYTLGEHNGNPALITTRDITFVVKPTNDAPVVKPDAGSTHSTLPSIAEDHTQTAAPGAGASTVGSLFGKYFDDSRDGIGGNQPAGADAGTGTQADSFFGVAIVGNSATADQGRWQYFDGTQWVDIPTDLSDGQALVLDKNVALQFIPAADWHGTPGELSVRLVENNANADTTSTTTSLVSGGPAVDINATGGFGGTSLFSADKVSLGITVTPVNDAPVATPDTHTMTENTPSVSGGLITQPGGAGSGVTGEDSDKDSALDPDEAITVTAVSNSDGIPGSVDGNGVITVAGKYGDLTVQPDGSYTYQLHTNDPAVNALVDGEHLTETFDYTITDSGGLSAASTLTITITGDDDGGEGVGITPTDSNGAGVGGHITVKESGLEHGSNPGSDASATGSLTFTAGNGLASVTIAGQEVTLAQLQGIDPEDSSTHLTIDVPGYGSVVITGFNPEPGHAAPVAGSIDYRFTLTQQQAHGNADGNNALISGIALQITDAGGKSSNGLLDVQIIDDVPTAKDDAFSIDEDETLTGDLKLDHANGKDLSSADDNTWTLVNGTVDGDGNTVLTTAQGGSVTLHPDGTFSYVPRADWHGTDSFEYTITDGDGDTSTATVTITVQPVVDIAPDSATTHVGQPVTTKVLGNDSFEGKTPVVSVEAGDGPSHGTVSVNPDGTITYTPNPGYMGTDSYVYTVTSGGVTETTTVTIDVSNTPPALLPDVRTTPEDTPVSGNVLSNDGDADNDPLTVTGITVEGVPHAVPPGGSVTVEIPGKGTITVGSDGGYTFTPVPDWHGSVPAIGYTVSDGYSNGSASSTLTITVTPVVDIAPDSATTPAGTPVTTPVLGNDSFEGKNPVVSVEPGNGPGHGTVKVNPDGSITYTPNPGYVGPDSYIYTVTSGGVTETTTVTIDVTNTPPVAAPEAVTTPEDTPVGGNLLDNDGDADSDPLVVTEIRVDGVSHAVPPGGAVTVQIPGKGSISVGSDGAYTFTPEADWHGAVPVIGYTVSDGYGSVSTTLTITVTPVVDISPDRSSTPEGTPVTTPVLGNDSFEGKTPVVSVEAGDGPGHGTVSVNPDGSITYAPNPGYVGPDSYVYTVTSGGVTETTTVSIEVTKAPPDTGTPVDPGTPWVFVPTPTPQVTPATPAEIPSEGQQSERPLADQAGRTPWKGDAAGDLSVFWENQNHDRIMRLPQTLHPITYVNRQVQSDQWQNQRETALGTDPALHSPGEMRSSSIGAGLGQDPALFVQHAVRGAQGEGQFWQLKAWRNAPNLPVQMPSNVPELDVPVLSSEEVPAPAQPAQAGGETPAAVAEAELLQRWALQAAAPAEAQETGAEPAAVAADSFSAQVRAHAASLPGHMS